MEREMKREFVKERDEGGREREKEIERELKLEG